MIDVLYIFVESVTTYVLIYLMLSSVISYNTYTGITNVNHTHQVQLLR